MRCVPCSRNRDKGVSSTGMGASNKLSNEAPHQLLMGQAICHAWPNLRRKMSANKSALSRLASPPSHSTVFMS